jgi:hypothetical protein
MNFIFYITNHGFGHASRNVPIIKRLLKEPGSKISVKTDHTRCEFLKRNLYEYQDHIFFYEDCKENGLILKKGEMLPDISEMERMIRKDFTQWGFYIAREARFLMENKIDVVISDIIPWALKAAKACRIPCLLIGNFTWSEMYKSYYSREIWEPYEECYRMADKAVWYEIHAKELHGYCKDYECVSMVSRSVDKREVEKIRNQFSKEIVFVSLGGSAEISRSIHVSHLPYEFLVTRGLKMVGDNVHMLPEDMVNTPDYIAASDYVIAKGGWSTVAEILLQRKKCALLFRGENSEDNNTKMVLEGRQQCIGLNGDELTDLGAVIDEIKQLNPDSYDIYQDDTEKICRTIMKTAGID